MGLALRAFLGVRGGNVGAANHKHEEENRRLQFDTNRISHVAHRKVRTAGDIEIPQGLLSITVASLPS